MQFRDYEIFRKLWKCGQLMAILKTEIVVVVLCLVTVDFKAIGFAI